MDHEAGSSARSNSEFVNIANSDHSRDVQCYHLPENLSLQQSNKHPTSETAPLLPAKQPQLAKPRLLGMSRIFGEKRTSSSPPPLSRHATAPPPSPVHANERGSLVDTPRTSISETSPTTLRSGSPPSPQAPSQSRPRLQSWKRRLKASPSLTLENTGSVARDHLASERTFLAYVRTSLAIASTGVALVQLFTISGSSTSTSTTETTGTIPRIQMYARPLGAITVIMGLVVLVTGLVRYFTIQTALTKGRFPVARVIIAFIAIVLSALVVVVFGVLVVVRRRD